MPPKEADEVFILEVLDYIVITKTIGELKNEYNPGSTGPA